MNSRIFPRNYCLCNAVGGSNKSIPLACGLNKKPVNVPSVPIAKSRKVGKAHFFSSGHKVARAPRVAVLVPDRVYNEPPEEPHEDNAVIEEPLPSEILASKKSFFEQLVEKCIANDKQIAPSSVAAPAQYHVDINDALINNILASEQARRDAELVSVSPAPFNNH